MTRPALVTIVLASLLPGVLAAPAAAQQPGCTERTQVIKQLASRYAEVPVSIGLAQNGGVVEVLSSRTGESWTIIITLPNGTSCAIAAGQHWETVPKVASLGPGA